MSTIQVTIDGKELSAKTGETILECALRHHIDIPHLCTHPALPPFGACRMCIVEVAGLRGYPTSCTTPVAEGMVVQTNTPELQRLRRNILGLIMLEHPNACLTCAKRDLCEEFRPTAEKVGRTTGCHTCNNKNGCHVRELSAELDLAQLPVPPTYHERPIERSNPFIDRDLNLCILCGRCVRICKHQQGHSVIDFIHRSSRTQIGEAFGRSLQEAGCTFCGSCVDVCPTGSLSDRYRKWYGEAEKETPTTCLFCEAACAVSLGAREGRPIGAKAVNEHVPVCLLGRFAIPEFLNSPDRLQTPQIRVGEVLRQVTWEEAVTAAKEKLSGYRGESFAFVCDATTPLEDRYLFRKFTEEVMDSPHYIEASPDVRGVTRVSLPKGVKALYLTGNFIDMSVLKSLDLLVVQDCFPSEVSEKAEVLLPAAVFAETSGTVLDGEGKPRPLYKACEAPGEARPEWEIVQLIAQAMEAKNFTFAATKEIAKEAELKSGALAIARDAAPPAALDFKVRRFFFRGHNLEERVAGLRTLEGKDICTVRAAGPDTATASGQESPASGAFLIVEKREISPNNHEIVVQAPEVAKKAKAGQFAIVMVDQASERVPYTLCDWDTEKGTITLVVQEKGKSSRKLIMCQAGDSLQHVVGPLGIPLEVKHYGTVALAGGCYGVGAITPIIRAMKEAGNHVIAVTEARSHYIAYHREKLEALADEFVQTTMDGSLGVHGHAVDAIEQMLKEGRQIDCVVAVGCPFMMMITANATRPFGVKTWAALNPIMVDGTGMCGACRISVGDTTKFACVDGPFFDAHLVDWMEVRDRRAAYSAEEIFSVGSTGGVEEPHHHHGGACSCQQH